MSERSVTIVHLSDLQFGKFHRFPEDADPSNTFDSLLPRLITDFGHLREKHGVNPDLLVVTGDLAEWGRKSELQQVFTFIAGAAKALGLPRHRVVVIPGNHDIDRDACAAYFYQCKSREIPLARPYEAKWTHFRTFFEELYRDVPGVTFTDTQPWTLYEFPELHTVIAGLNSTWMDSHLEEDHYGCVGEPQLRWFESKLRERQYAGWLRIAAVHHNVRREPVRDDENLRDANRFSSILGPLVNVVLHGHTHDGKTDVLRKNVPIYSTGSAAVGAGQRPPEVPNQYQVLQITPTGVRRWARAYRADERKFIGDNRASDDGNHWQTHETFDFSHFGADEDPLAKPRHLDWQPALERSRPDELIDRIERVCHIRHPGAAQTTVFRSSTDPMPYISLGIQDGPVTTQYPIGATEEPVTREMLLAFASTIQSRYSRDDRSVGSLIVYGGDKSPDEALQREAQRLGVTLQSWVQFQGLIPFGDYVESQRRQLQRDPRYLPHLFVPQKIRYTTPAGEAVEHDDALEAMLDMLTEPEGRFIVILGEFGTGKSFLQRQIALRLSDLPRPQPILIEMRTLEKAHDFDQLIAQHLVRHGFPSLNLRAFRYMLEQGRLALLFDGFDELALRVSYDRAADHLQTLIQAAAGNAKIVVTSRTEYFESDQQVKTALAEKLEVIGGRRLVHLQRFDRPRIVQYLTRQLGSPEAAAERMKLLEDVEDLSGLSENARMLTFISSLDEEQLRRARTREGRVTRSSIYRTLVVDKWLAFEEERLSPRGAAPPLSKEERLEAVIILARHMWSRPDATVKLSELSERIADVVGRLPRIDASAATHQVASGTLLVRDADGNFSFVHRSILEWIIAIDAASEIRAGRTPEALMVNDISPLVADFIAEEVADDTLAEWLRATTASAETDSMLRRNALVLIGRLSGTDRVTIDGTTAMQLSGADLRGRDFSNSSMQQANLEGADLTDTRFINADLRGANLRKAILRAADLTNANLAGADLSDADLSRALLRNANLREAQLTGASLFGANLLNANLRDAALDGADLTGAAGTPHAREIRPLFEDRLTPITLAFSPRGDLLAALHRRSIRVFDLEAGRELGTYLVPLDCTLSCVAWSGDGHHLLAGTAEGQAILWDLGSALPQWGVKVHDTPVLTIGETGATIVVVTTAVVKTLQKTSGKFGRASFTLPVSAVAADVDSVTGGVVVALEDGRLAEIFRRELLVWGPRWSATDYIGVTVSAAGRIAAFATQTGLHVVSPEETLVTTRLRAASGTFAMAGDGSRVAFQDRQSITMISVASATVQEIPVRHALWLALDQGGGRLAYFDGDDTLATIDTTYTELTRFSIPPRRLFALRMESDYELQAMTADGAWHSLDARQGQLREVSKPIDGATGVHYPGKNAVQYLTFGKNQILVMDAVTATKRIVNENPSSFAEAAIGDDGTVAYSDGHQVVLLPRKGREHKVNIAEARFMRFDANCSLLFVVDGSDQLSIVDVKTGRREHTRQLAHDVFDVSVSRREIAFLTWRKAVILRLPDLDQIAEIPGPVRPESLAYSASGALLAVVGRASLTIRDTATGVVRNAPLAVRSYFRAAFSPSERSIACATIGGAIDIFDVQSLELKVSVGLTPEAWVVFRPDGRFKAAGDLQARFAHVIGLCRFGPGELDPWLDKPLRVPDDQPLFETF